MSGPRTLRAPRLVVLLLATLALLTWAAPVLRAAGDTTGSGPESEALTSAEQRSTEIASNPLPGTLAWALAVESARQAAFTEPESVDALISRYRRLLDLHAGCTACRPGIYHFLKDSLRHYFHDQRAIDKIEEEEFAEHPVELAKLLLRTGRAAQAGRVARKGLGRVRLVERRAELQAVLAQVHSLRGETKESQALLRRMTADAALSPDSCPDFLDDPGEMERLRESLDRSGLRRQLEQLGDMQREQKGDPALTCLYSSLLVSIRKLVGRLPADKVGVSDDDVASLFPDGIEAVQKRLAEAASSPRIRAAVLLGAADGELRDPPDPVSALELLADAETTSNLPQDRVAVLRLRLRALWMAHRPEEARSVAARLVAEFPRYYAACEACGSPANFDGASRWVAACGKLTADCYEPVGGWKQQVFAVPRGSAAVLEALLNSHPPEEVVPLILSRLSDDVHDTAPDRSQEIEQQAIHHPEFPALVLDHRDRESRAAQRGDFGTALFLALAFPPRDSASCIPGEKVFRDRDFRIAYYKVRLGIDSGRQWQILLDLLSDAPELEKAGVFYRTEILDVLVQAARADHREPEAATWFEALRQRYREARGRVPSSPFRTDDPSSPANVLRRMELMLGGYIRELEATR